MVNQAKNPGARAGASGADKPIQTVEGNFKIACRKRRVTYAVAPNNADTSPVTVTLVGRVLWALERLVHAGPRGCTPISEPAPRWAAYVHTLRGLGVPIETINEEHEGDFPGTHARYVLRATVIIQTEGGTSDGKSI